MCVVCCACVNACRNWWCCTTKHSVHPSEPRDHIHCTSLCCFFASQLYKSSTPRKTPCFPRPRLHAGWLLQIKTPLLLSTLCLLVAARSLPASPPLLSRGRGVFLKRTGFVGLGALVLPHVFLKRTGFVGLGALVLPYRIGFFSPFGDPFRSMKYVISGPDTDTGSVSAHP